MNGRFAMPGGGNSAIVGDPDFSPVMSSRAHPKVIVHVSAPTCVLVKPRCRLSTKLGEQRIWGILSLPHHDALSQQSLHALEQTYGYMTFNDNKFGILTNWKHALFLRRAETPDRKTLAFYLVELD